MIFLIKKYVFDGTGAWVYIYKKSVCVCGRGGGVGEEHGIRGYYENKLNLIY